MLFYTEVAMKKNNKDYLSIGKVSKMKNVSIKALRYYDEIGILKPVYVNPDTNYRYYSPKQLDILDAIHMCLTLGMPLRKLSSYEKSSESDSVASSSTAGIMQDIDYQRLLNVCKVMADSKISDIYKTLDSLKETSEKITSEQYDMMKDMDSRYLLVTEFAENELMNPKLLQLFMLSQQLGVNAHYPAGILNQGNKRYVFLMLDALNPQAPNYEQLKHSENIIKLPKASYSYCYTKELTDLSKLHGLFSRPYLNYVQLNLINETLNQEGYMYEVQGY